MKLHICACICKCRDYLMLCRNDSYLDRIQSRLYLVLVTIAVLSIKTAYKGDHTMKFLHFQPSRIVHILHLMTPVLCLESCVRNPSAKHHSSSCFGSGVYICRYVTVEASKAATPWMMALAEPAKVNSFAFDVVLSTIPTSSETNKANRRGIP